MNLEYTAPCKLYLARNFCIDSDCGQLTRAAMEVLLSICGRLRRQARRNVNEKLREVIVFRCKLE